MNIKVKLGIGVVIMLIVTIIIVVCTMPSPSKSKPALNQRLIFLLGTTENEILFYDYESGRIDPLLENNVEGITSFTSYYNETIYYATRKPNDTIYSSSPKYKNLTRHSREWTKSAMTMDHITKNVYILDRPSKTIHLVDSENGYHRVIISNLSDPIDIVLDVELANLFVLQSSSILQIEIGRQNVTEIIKSSDLTAFTVDFSRRTIYYTNGKTIISYNYRTKEKLSEYKVRNVISLAVAKNYLFVIEDNAGPSERTISVCNIDEISNCQFKQLINRQDLEKIKFFDINPLEADNLCNTNRICSQICMTRFANNCECTDGWNLKKNGECYPSDKLFVNIDNDEVAEYFLINNTFGKLVRDEGSGIKSFDVYNQSKVIYGSVKTNFVHCEVETCEVTPKAHEWSKSGLAFDASTGNFYVADEVNGNINVAKIGTVWYKTLLKDLDKPKNVVLDPESGLMFIQIASAVLRANMDGSDSKEIYRKVGLTAITLDTRNKKLYIAVPKAVVCIDYKENKRSKITNLNDTEILSLAVMNGDLFAVIEKDSIKRSIQQCHQQNDDETCEFKVVHEHDFIVDIKSKPEFEKVETSCSKLKKKCVHLCLPKSGSYSCQCSDDYYKNTWNGQCQKL